VLKILKEKKHEGGKGEEKDIDLIMQGGEVWSLGSRGRWCFTVVYLELGTKKEGEK